MVKINQKKTAKKAVKAKNPKKAQSKAKTIQKKAQPRTEISLFQTHRPTRRIKDPVGYYDCLCKQAQMGFTGKKITEACRECKHLAPSLSANRIKEIKKLTSAYKQIGVSLSKLLQN